MSMNISFRGLNDRRVLESDAFHALEDGADIREVTKKLVADVSNEAAQVFGYDRITVQNRWLLIKWDPQFRASLYYNAGIYSAPGHMVVNPLFLADIINKYGADAFVGVLCHEIGHRQVYLIFQKNGFEVNNWENEYCADYVAGLLLRLANCDPNGMFRILGELCAQSSDSHPAGKNRQVAFRQGYQLVDRHRETVFFRTPAFSQTLNASQVFTPTFMRNCLLEDIIYPLRRK